MVWKSGRRESDKTERTIGRGTRRERKSREEQKINILSSKKQTSRSIELEKEGKEQIG